MPAEGIDAFVVLPSPEGPLPPAALRQVASCALVRLADATVWFLRARDGAWSPERLATTARVLVAQAPFRRDAARLTGTLRHELRAPTLAVLPAVLDEVDAASWDLRGLAIAIAIRSRCGSDGALDPAAIAEATRDVEDELRAALAPALAEFAGRTDSEAMRAVVAATGAADVAIYNYLVEPPHRVWRLQLAQTFPLLLRAAAIGEAASVGETIRNVVDRGDPLVRTLAARWGVDGASVRCLRGKDAALVGRHWEGNVRGLARLLDALRPEDRPKEDPAAWARFNGAVAAAERIFRCPPWGAPVAQMWLRDAARRSIDGSEEESARRVWDAAAVAAVHRFRDTLARVLELEHGDASHPPGAAARLALEAAANRFVASRQPRRLREIAERFERELRDPRTESARQAARIANRRHWPLLPNDMTSADGSRIVLSLIERDALDRHGNALDICLTGDYLAPASLDATQAAHFILGLVNAARSTPVSTAEIRVSRSLRDARFHAEVLQHTGFRNRPPSRACASALAEALAAARSPAGQAHLEAAFRALRERARVSQAEADRRAERALLDDVLTRTLGPAMLAEIVTTARRRAEATRRAAG